MSSWLSLSLPNPFKSENESQSSTPTPPSHDHSPPHSTGVKEDFSVIGQTIGRQLRGVAAFLAPPPSPHSAATSASDEESESSSSHTFLGIKNDLVEIGGSFKTSLSLLSSNKAVTEISRFASNFLQFQNEGDEEDGASEDAVGITEEVLDFVREISLRPECWTDFPLALQNDFDMSDVQRGHAATVEHLVPSLVALRHQICGNLSYEEFWMIYFILLLPRLNENDFKLLSTPEIVEAREILLQKLRNKGNTPAMTSEDSESVILSQKGLKANSTKGDKNLSQGKEVSAEAEAVNPVQRIEIDDHENTEQWLEDDVDTCASVDAQKQPENEEDVTFSDLEDDDNDLSDRSLEFRPAQSNKTSSPSESNEWVRLNENSGTLGDRHKARQSTSREKDSEGEESNDWLTVDDIDLDSLADV